MTGGAGEKREKVLAVFAHPDDETLLAGALIASLVDDGHEVHLLCVAPGSDPDLLARMERAAADLGISSVSSLRFAPASEAPGGVTHWSTELPSLISAPLSVVAGMIEGRIAELTPTAVLTHSPEGDYGHPDHIYCHAATVLAARARLAELAVYALAWPRSMLKLNSLAGKLLGLAGRLARWSDRPKTTLPTGVDEPARLPVTCTHDVRRFLAVRRRAVRRYRKEIARGPLPLRMLETAPTWLQRFVLGKACLSRVR